MTATLLERLYRREVRIGRVGVDLVIDAPAGALDDDLLAAVKEVKPALLETMASPRELVWCSSPDCIQIVPMGVELCNKCMASGAGA